MHARGIPSRVPVKIHALQTGKVRIKTAQIEGRGKGIGRQLAIFRDSEWAWVPTFAYAVEHPEGVIVIDTGQGLHLLRHAESLHPYLRWQVDFEMQPEDEIGPRLRALGIGRNDVKKLILTHLHVDHDGGLAHFPNTEIFAARGEIDAASGWGGRLNGYLPQRWPNFFDPKPVDFTCGGLGPFEESHTVTKAGDVIALPLPGHTANHLGVFVETGDDLGTCVLFAGDASYNSAMMQQGKVDGVSPNETLAGETLAKTRKLAAQVPLIYLPAHDPQAAERLLQCRTA